MSEMRLRHKKPINSYVGQGNYDSNQVQDQDFAKNSLQNKKVRLLKARPVKQQTKKYAQILCEFVNVVNQDYRNHYQQFPAAKSAAEQKDQKPEPNFNLPANRDIKDNNYVKSQEVVSKQQQKIRKPENYISKHSVPTKKIKREKPIQQQVPKSRQVRDGQSKIVTTINIESKPPTLGIPKQNINQEKEKQPTLPANNPGNSGLPFNPQQPGSLAALDQIAQLQQIQLLQSQIMALNQGMIPIYPYLHQLPPYMNYPLYLEQMKNNPYLMQGMMGSMFPNLPNLPNSYIPFSKLPFQKGNPAELKKQESQGAKQTVSAPQINMFQPNPSQATSKNPQFQQKLRQKVQKQYPKNSMCPGNEKQKQKQKQPTNTSLLVREKQKQKQKGDSDPTQSLIQPIDFKKKSCYHVATAYNIHFARLKEKGLLSWVNTEQGFQKLDPTFPARMVRQRKTSQSAHNTQK